jgi:hypothetical protein
MKHAHLLLYLLLYNRRYFLEDLATEVWLVESQQVKRFSEGIDGLDTYVNNIVSTISI